MKRTILVAVMGVLFAITTWNCGFVLAECPSADLTGNCFVDFEDFAVMLASYGLRQGEEGFRAEADITGDDWVNNIDDAIMVSHFQEECTFIGIQAEDISKVIPADQPPEPVYPE